MTASASQATASDTFNCKGGSTTQIMLSLVKKQFDVQDLPDNNPDLRRATAIAGKLAKLSEKTWSSPVETEIGHSLEFIESIHAKFKEIGTTAAKGNDEILTSQTAGLIQEADALNARRVGLLEDIEQIRNQYREAMRTRLRNPENPAAAAQFATFENSITVIDTKLTQLRREQTNLARRMDGAEKTGINLLPDPHKVPFLNRREQIRGPGN